MNQGTDWQAISGDLTNGGKKGNVAYGTLASISESPFQFGLIYTGSDDGLVHVTKNGGGDWTNISSSFPRDLWVSRVIASEHKKERVYVTLNGYRWDDFKTYVYKSDNYGQTWTDISSNLPLSPVNVIREDSENENILYLGTDNGAYVSMDMGQSWNAFSNGLPNVAVHDIVLQTEAKDLLLGTHGRSIYKANVAPLQTFESKNTTQDVVFFDTKPIRESSRWGSSWSQWLDAYEPEVTFQFYSNSEGSKTLKIMSEDGKELNQMTVDIDKGFNYVDYHLDITEKGRKALMKADTTIDILERSNGKYYLPKGVYTIELGDASTKLEIK